MRFVVPAVLLLVAAIHALPVLGVLGPSKLASLYGVAVEDPNLDILLRHRALLFGLLAVFLAYAAFQPGLRRLALLAAFFSVGSFLVLVLAVGSYNPAIATVVRVDLVALVLLVVGGLAHALKPR